MRRRIVRGYGILQPRVAISLPGTNRSRYARLYGGEPGIDPYTRAVSDVYQDVFGEGSFIGKGIYDVDAFEQALGGRFPENRILSHDLLEGCYARCGAAERRACVRGLSGPLQRRREPPPPLDSRRLATSAGCRLVAGRVPGRRMSKRRAANPLSLLSQWKLIDNLRRSLVPPPSALLLCWLGRSAPRPGWWTLSVIGILLIPPLRAAVLDLVPQAPRGAVPAALERGRQTLLAPPRADGRSSWPACPTRPGLSLDAIVRSAWRVGVGPSATARVEPVAKRVARERPGARGDLAASCARCGSHR